MIPEKDFLKAVKGLSAKTDGTALIGELYQGRDLNQRATRYFSDDAGFVYLLMMVYGEVPNALANTIDPKGTIRDAIVKLHGEVNNAINRARGSSSDAVFNKLNQDSR